jgi:hypothetical protein
MTRFSGLSTKEIIDGIINASISRELNPDEILFLGYNPTGAIIVLTSLVIACQRKSVMSRHQLKLQYDNYTVRALLGAGADPNLENPVDCSSLPALYMAVKYGDVDTVNLLVEFGANAMVTNRVGDTVLKNAAEQADGSIMARLIELGVPVNHRVATTTMRVYGTLEPGPSSHRWMSQRA